MNNSGLSILLQRSAVGSVLTTPSDLGALPWFIRFSLADLFAQAKYGEQVALGCAKTLLELETGEDERAFAITQARDEASHVAFFEAAERDLRVTRPVLPPLKRLLDTAASQTDLPNVLLGTHLIVETLAHDLFSDVAKRLQALGRSQWLPQRWAVAFRDVAGSMLGISRDESRHVAFGVLRLAALRESMSAGERVQLDQLAQHWVSQLEATLEALPVLFLLKPIKREIVRGVMLRCRQRCIDVGLEVGR